jgi:hypothetical protein
LLASRAGFIAGANHTPAARDSSGMRSLALTAKFLLELCALAKRRAES